MSDDSLHGSGLESCLKRRCVSATPHNVREERLRDATTQHLADSGLTMLDSSAVLSMVPILATPLHVSLYSFCEYGTFETLEVSGTSGTLHLDGACGHDEQREASQVSSGQ